MSWVVDNKIELIPLGLLVALALVYRFSFKRGHLQTHSDTARQGTNAAAIATATLSEREKRVLQILVDANGLPLSRSDLQDELGWTYLQTGFVLNLLGTRAYIQPVTDYLLNPWSVIGDTRVSLTPYGLQYAEQHEMLPSQ